jgi:hypothetical protein
MHAGFTGVVQQRERAAGRDSNKGNGGDPNGGFAHVILLSVINLGRKLRSSNAGTFRNECL